MSRAVRSLHPHQLGPGGRAGFTGYTGGVVADPAARPAIVDNNTLGVPPVTAGDLASATETAEAIRAAIANPGGGGGGVSDHGALTGLTDADHAPAAIIGTAVITNDARLTNARTPTAHKASHEDAGADEVRSQVTDDDTVDVLASEIEFVFEPSAGLLRGRVTVTGAQLVTANSVPIAAIPAPGAGKVIVPYWRTIEWKPGTATFDAFDLGCLAYDGDAFNATILRGGAGMFNATVPGVDIAVFDPQGATVNPIPRTLSENKPLMITADVDPTVTGSPDGNAYYTVWYTIEDLH